MCKYCNNWENRTRKSFFDDDFRDYFIEGVETKPDYMFDSELCMEIINENNKPKIIVCGLEEAEYYISYCPFCSKKLV